MYRDLDRIPPEIIVLTLMLVTATGIAMIFIALIRNSRRLASEEVGLTPILSEICGGRIGHIKYTTPFVRVTLYQSLLVVAARRTVVLQAGQIDRIVFERDRRSAAFGKTVNIHHSSSAVRSPICLYSSSGANLASRLAVITTQR